MSDVHPRSKQHGWSNGGEQADKIDLISEYKFLLAFENSDLVDDYVTGAHTDGVRIFANLLSYRKVRQCAPGGHCTGLPRLAY